MFEALENSKHYVVLAKEYENLGENHLAHICREASTYLGKLEEKEKAARAATLTAVK
nr:hypothetical protein 16 [Bacillales bacterium]